MYKTDTIAAIATALSNSGIAIIRVSGDNAIDITDSVFCTKSGKRVLKNAPGYTMHYGYITECPVETEGDEEYKKHIVDEVIVSVFRAPKSFTAEDTVEINCHGGVMVVQKILKIIISAGARMAQPGEFTKRAFMNGRIDLSRAEAVMDLIHSNNEYALKASVNQLKGVLSDKIRELRQKIIYEIAFIESALDDPEHISLEGYPERLEGITDTVIYEIKKLLDTAENGRIIKEGISTVIVGKPNAGKSSLMNMILGQDRAIVTDIAGTTRDVLEECVRVNGISLNITDTAGIRDTEDLVEKIGVEKARKYAEDADLILYVADSSVELDDNDRDIMKMIRDKKVIFIMNKSDLVQKTQEEDIFRIYYEGILSDEAEGKRDNIRVVHTSAKEKSGFEDLGKVIESLFFEGSIQNSDEIMITNIRHKEALQNAYDSMQMVKRSLEDQMPEDFYSIDLMAAYAYLGSIIGEETGDDLVEEIFSKFCMGK